MPETNDTARSGIYQIRNLKNGKVYIGSAVDLGNRWSSHRQHLRRGTHHSDHLQKAWNKYGEYQFIFEVLEVVEDRNDLIRIEQSHLDRTRSFARDVGYNICPTAGSMLGFKPSAETRALWSRQRTGRKLSPEHIATVLPRLLEVATSPEHREKLRVASQSPEAVAKRAAALKGRKLSPETRAKMSDAAKGRKPAPSTIAGVKEANLRRRGTKRDPAALAKAWATRRLNPECLTNYARGTANGNAKLDEDRVRGIRRLFSEIGNKQAVARAFGVSRTQVLNILQGKVWSHVI